MPAGLFVGASIIVVGSAWAFAVAWLVAKYEDA